VEAFGGSSWYCSFTGASIRGAQSVEVDAAHNGWMVKPEEVASALADAVEMVAAGRRRNLTLRGGPGGC